MDVITIHGGRPLRGVVSASGSKNAALSLMAASILTDEPTVLSEVPDVTDVNAMALVLGHVGVEVKRHVDGRMHFSTVDSRAVTAGPELVSRMRAGFCVLGPLLARRGKAIVALPGGCRIGPRPIDLHLQGLTALGAKIRIENGCVVAQAKSLRGVEMDLSGPNGPTVTGTANVLMAAVLARGETVICGAAREPEIADLGTFLISLGARIDGLGTSTLRIRGVSQLGGGRHRVIPDRMETATLLLAGAVAAGDVTVRNCRPDHLDSVLAVLDDAGVMLDTGSNWIRVATSDRPQPFHFTALPYPGVPTDLQAPFTALAALADGKSIISDRVFPHRFGHVAKLNELGACIRRDRATAVVTGVDRLSGGEIAACDLRSAAALVLAGLSMSDQTVVRNAFHLRRGHELLPEKLRGLGACIESAAESCKLAGAAA
jgi:UDP-N-acetylglucosamine 1-carboxyvinyltransferase